MIGTSDKADLRLVWAIRATAAALGLALVCLGVFFYTRYAHASVSVVDRDTQAIESEIRQHPDDPGLRVAAANLYVAKGRSDLAVVQAEQVLKADPENLGAILALADARAALGQRDLAAIQLKHAVELNKDNPMSGASLQLALVHHKLGKIYLEQGMAAEAVAEFERALAIDPSNADSLYLMGKALAAQGKVDDAIDSYRRALRLVPDFPEVYNELYRAYETKGDLAHADAVWGLVRFSAGETDQALEILEKSARAGTDMVEVHLGLAMIYEKKGDTARALAEYRQALTMDASSVAARQGIGRMGGQP